MNTPPDPKAYSETVWKIVRQIPARIVSTYGQIASMIPPPNSVDPADYARLGPVWVGKAMNAVSAADTPGVPWQRVINSQGGISLPEGSRSALEQRARLEREGVTFDKNGRVNLNQYGWDGPEANWLREHDLLTPRPLKKPDKPQQPTLF
ncbi:MAG TPA: MGMT family protein [Phototrophicaceae bacterium]|nr:MGMT family protein [Phototrophicaceae bacterium]